MKYIINRIRIAYKVLRMLQPVRHAKYGMPNTATPGVLL